MIDYKTFSKFVENDELELEYDRVTHDISKISDVPHALDTIFKYHRYHGFPHYRATADSKIRDMKSLYDFNESAIFRNGYIDQTMHTLGLAWSYFPHWVDVQCGNNKMKPIDYWNNDDKLKEIIRKTWEYHLKHSDGKFTINRLRQNFKIYGGNQTVSNFRPSAAKWIYNTYTGDTVWDMSCGWGGRLIGFLTSNYKTYIGTEPSEKTYDGLIKLSNELNYYSKNVILHKMGSEDFIPESNSLDLCFTSPPYFDTEKYSDEITQSYKKFPTSELWVEGFLRKTIENCYIGLKPTGKLLLNIANTPKYKNIESETIRIANDVGFRLDTTIKLALSSVAGKGIKYEPIFIFIKK